MVVNVGSHSQRLGHNDLLLIYGHGLLTTHTKLLVSRNVTKVEGAKTNTPPKTNTYKRVPISNTLLP